MLLMRAAEQSDLVGHNILDFVLPGHQEVANERMNLVRQGQPVASVEMEIRRCDGEVIWIETIASATSWQGEAAVQMVARDVTERRKAPKPTASSSKRSRTRCGSWTAGSTASGDARS
jgi:PAS domain S-box-containing protein